MAEIVSVEEIELYKPHPAVYRHAAERLGVEAAADHADRGARLGRRRREGGGPRRRRGSTGSSASGRSPKGEAASRVAHDLVEAAELALAKR